MSDETTKLRAAWRDDKAEWAAKLRVVEGAHAHAVAEIQRLRKLGNEMASQIEERWTSPGGCDCSVCSAAAAWRKATSGQSDRQKLDEFMERGREIVGDEITDKAKRIMSDLRGEAPE